MATIEGNEIALRNVFDELTPKSRDRSTAKENNDNLAPFYTHDYNVTLNYQDSLAPSWVYGLTYEGPGDNDPLNVFNDQGPIVVTWGTQNQGGGAQETVLFAGQTLEFPRGARRVFVRSAGQLFNQIGAWIKLTWKLDLYAHKHYSARKDIQTQLWDGSGGPDIRDLGPGFGVLASPRSQLMLIINNTSTVAITYTLLWHGTLYTLDTATQAPGVLRRYYYGPGIGSNLPAGSQGHDIAFPNIVLMQILPNAPAGPGDQVEIAWWAR